MIINTACQHIRTEANPAPPGPSSMMIPSSATILLGSILMISSKPGSFVRSSVIAAISAPELNGLEGFADLTVPLPVDLDNAAVAAFKVSLQINVSP